MNKILAEFDDWNPQRVEWFLWVVIALLISSPAWIDYFLWRSGPLVQIISVHSPKILGALLIVIFPLAYRLIFDVLPLEHVRASQKRIRTIKIGAAARGIGTQENATVEEAAEAHPATVTAEEWLRELVEASGLLANKLYTRSGVYLLVGVLIAFSGLGFFYLQASTIEFGSMEISVLLTQMLPRFGILFFIELIAFFFLRQYRSAMDEFRYFEAVQRNREENLLHLLFVAENSERVDPLAVIEQIGLRSHLPVLQVGETTERLESRKLTKDELVLFGQLLERLPKLK